MKTKITFANITDVGLVREQNEDRAIVCNPGDELASQLGYLIALADGMGGHEAGEVAAQIALKELADRFYSCSDKTEQPEHTLTRVIQQVNAAVYEAARKRSMSGNMGTTLVCAVIKDNWLWVANVGDSRAYLVRKGTALQLTRDHSWAAERGFSAEEAKRTPFRSAITRAIGILPTVEVDVFTELLLPRDVVLLCSDGLTKHLEDRLIGKELARSRELRKGCINLVRRAKRGGGTDNITVVAARMINVRKRPGQFTVARAFPQSSDRLKRRLSLHRRIALVGSAVVGLSALVIGLWQFHIFDDIRVREGNVLDPVSSPSATGHQNGDLQSIDSVSSTTIKPNNGKVRVEEDSLMASQKAKAAMMARPDSTIVKHPATASRRKSSVQGAKRGLNSRESQQPIKPSRKRKTK